MVIVKGTKEYIKQIDEYGNVDGHSSNKAYSGDPVDGREAPEGCTPYEDACHAPLYGSGAKVTEKVVEKKIKHPFKKKAGNFGSNYHK